MPSSGFLSIVVPAYNEEENIQSVLDSIGNLENKLPIPFEVIVVDDGSTDKTAKIASSFGYVKVEKNERNLGKGAAVRRGVKVSKGDIIIIQDADSEYFPSEIPMLIELILRGDAKVVYGSRFLGGCKMAVSRYAGNKLLSFATSILYHRRITDMMTGHKAFTRDVINSINLVRDDFAVEAEITAKLLKKRYEIKEIPIRYNFRRKGNSKLSWNDGVKALMLLIKLRFFNARTERTR